MTCYSKNCSRKERKHLSIQFKMRRNKMLESGYTYGIEPFFRRNLKEMLELGAVKELKTNRRRNPEREYYTHRLAVNVYTLLRAKATREFRFYGEEHDRALYLEFKEHFMPWVHDHSQEDNILGGLELSMSEAPEPIKADLWKSPNWVKIGEPKWKTYNET